MFITACCVCLVELRRQEDGRAENSISSGYCRPCYLKRVVDYDLATEEERREYEGLGESRNMQ